MRTEAYFVKPDDFFNYTGRDLNAELQINGNLSNAANIFLMQIEDRLLARIDMMSFRIHRWDQLSDYQKESLQKAIIVEAEYIIRNSDLFTDSGYDLEKGEVISSAKLRDIEICRASLDLLRKCGLLNQVIQNRYRWNRWIRP